MAQFRDAVLTEPPPFKEVPSHLAQKGSILSVTVWRWVQCFFYCQKTPRSSIFYVACLNSIISPYFDSICLSKATQAPTATNFQEETWDNFLQRWTSLRQRPSRQIFWTEVRVGLIIGEFWSKKYLKTREMHFFCSQGAFPQ